MIFLLTAEYSLKTNTEEINMTTNATNTKKGFSKTLLDQIALDTLGRDCGFGGDERSSITCIIDRFCEMKQEIERLKSQLAEKEVSDDEEEEHTEEDATTAFWNEAIKHGLTPAQREHGLATIKELVSKKLNPEQLTEKVNADIIRIVREHAELKGQVEHLILGGYYCHTRPAPNAEINTNDAAFDHYWSVQNNDLTLWKVPRHLADVASAQTDNHGAVEQAFYDECFGEEYGNLKWMRVREMTQADLVKGGWQPEEKVEKYTDCEECGRFCYTGGEKYPDGYVCNDCDEDAENSDDDE